MASTLIKIIFFDLLRYLGLPDARAPRARPRGGPTPRIYLQKTGQDIAEIRPVAPDGCADPARRRAVQCGTTGSTRGRAALPSPRRVRGGCRLRSAPATNRVRMKTSPPPLGRSAVVRSGRVGIKYSHKGGAQPYSTTCASWATERPTTSAGEPDRCLARNPIACPSPAGRASNASAWPTP
jgi:hypothetical protein